MTVLRPLDRRAASRLQVLRDSFGTWRKVGAHLGVNAGDCVHVVKGSRRANAKMLKALGLVKPRKPRNLEVELSMSRSDAREILEFKTFPNSLRERLLKSVDKYDKRASDSKGV